ncbi:MAG: asparagine synthase (glutamine-hydrolyzing) [Alphaproteobacteria bacterium]
MCGITGILERAPQSSADALAALTRRMAGTLVHRGPDSDGVWTDAAQGIALGHRRLSIIDLSPAGHQPMMSASDRLVLSYNGEIYNYRALRRELEAEGVPFRGNSDSEVLLEAIAHWGLARTLPRLVGMFAFALWDRETRVLTLVRDRLGIKPLYWAEIGGRVVFASELKALRGVKGWTGEIDRQALAAYLRHNYVPAPHTIYRGVFKLEPGSLMRFSPSQASPADQAERYWDLRAIARKAVDAPPDITEAAAIERVHNLIREAVSARMVADVPLGALLSGGLDSSAVTAVMQAASDRPVRSFSIGFGERDFDESDRARAIAAHLGTDHTEVRIEGQEALDLVPRLPEIWDEPFGDSSQIPSFLVSRVARRDVTVALSGDGGDEVFLGYNRHRWAPDLWDRIEKMPLWLRRMAARAGGVLPADVWRALAGLVPEARRPRQADLKMIKLLGVLDAPHPNAIYRRLVSQWPDPVAVMRGAREYRGLIWDGDVNRDLPDFTDRMQFWDMATYLPDDILTKVDRASMANSLEVRVPLLDHRLVEFIWSLPRAIRHRRDHSKYLLRRVAENYLPANLLDQPKSGFAVPLGAWLRGPLRDWAEELLATDRLAEEGFFFPDTVREAWAGLLAGDPAAEQGIWGLLMFQAWHEKEKAEGPEGTAL